MKREVIAVDMDDVVVESSHLIIDHVNKTYGTSVRLDQFYSRDPSVWGVSNIHEAIQRVNAFLVSDDYHRNTPIQQSVAALRRLKEHHRLYIVTGRPDFIEGATRQWLATHLPGLFEDVIFSNYFHPDKVRTKGDICRQLEATVLIDDHLDHCVSAFGAGVRPLLFGRYPWNNGVDIPDGIERVEHWRDVERLLLA